jgi:hypothetical protein
LNTGAIYIYEKNGSSWPATESFKLMASDKDQGDNFGTAVAIDGNTIVVSAPDWDLSPVTDAGAVYVFEKTNGSWTEKTKCRAASGSDSNFGCSVDIYGDILIVGASGYTDGGISRAGAAYLFERSSGQWPSTETVILKAAVKNNDNLGTGVGAMDGAVVVGAYAKDYPFTSQSGGAYLFVKNTGTGTWPSTETQELYIHDRIANGFLGERVDGYNDRFILGSENGAYIFIRNSDGSWPSNATIKAHDNGIGVRAAVGITNQYYVLGLNIGSIGTVLIKEIK